MPVLSLVRLALVDRAPSGGEPEVTSVSWTHLPLLIDERHHFLGAWF